MEAFEGAQIVTDLLNIFQYYVLLLDCIRLRLWVVVPLWTVWLLEDILLTLDGDSEVLPLGMK